YLLSNFSAETFPPAFERFDFLRWFRGMVISGEVGVIKPDPRIYEIMLARFAIDPHRAVYIDDVAVNAEVAAGMGIHGIHFTTPAALRDELEGQLDTRSFSQLRKGGGGTEKSEEQAHASR